MRLANPFANPVRLREIGLLGMNERLSLIHI